MTFSNMLLRARSIGVRDFRDHASRYINRGLPLIITGRGRKESVLLPYEDVVELAEIIDELHDQELLKTIAEGRKAVRRASAGILFSEHRKKHKSKVAHK